MTIEQLELAFAEKSIGSELSKWANEVRSIGECPNGICGIAEDVWQKHIAEHSKTFAWDGYEVLTKSLNESSADGFILEFDGVATRKEKDRDGDLVEPAGWTLEEKMPLLWMHNHHLPVGRKILTVKHDNEIIVCKYGIVDTTLGRDCKVLVKADALRLSQGFRVLEAEPIGKKTRRLQDGRDVPAEWHLKKGHMLETSLVSIPALASAVILGHSEKEFESRLFKSWHKSIAATRNVQVAVPNQIVEIRVTVDQAKPVETKSFAESKEVVTEKSMETKDGSTQKEKMLGVDTRYLKGSYEWQIEKLHEAVEKMARDKLGLSRDSGYSAVTATFADECVFCVRDWSKDESKCYRVGWKMDGDMPVIDGDATEVEITMEMKDKCLSPIFKSREQQPETTVKELLSGVLSGDKRMHKIAGEVKSLLEVAKTAEVDSELSRLLGT